MILFTLTQQTQTWENIQDPCINLKEIIGCPLLWMVCWKHVREVHVGKEFDILKVEVRLSPDLLVFKRSRKFSAKLYLGQSQRNYF